MEAVQREVSFRPETAPFAAPFFRRDEILRFARLGRRRPVAVSDLKQAAEFYEKVFELKRVRSIPGILEALSDGTMNITLLKYETDEMAGDERGKDFVGIHHIGFIVDDLDKTAKTIERNGGRFHKAATPETQAENKYRTPDGVVFDIARPEHLWTDATLPD